MLSTSTASTGRFLGISAKSSDTLKPKRQAKSEADKLNIRTARYNLQRHSQSLFFDETAEKQHRVCSCHRNLAGDSLAIYRKVDSSDARVSGLVSCGSAWVCPVCNAKITEARREQMQQAITAHAKAGGSCLLLTLTFPHTYEVSLEESLERFADALDRFKDSRTYKRIFGTSLASIAHSEARNKPLKKITPGQHQTIGSVRSLEVTHGQNGWHPHTHQVMFMQNEALLDDRRAIDELTHTWVDALLKAGIGDHSNVNDMLAHALDLRGGDYTADYVNKFGREPGLYEGWTIAHEVTKANSKAGYKFVNGDYHATPFQLLRASLEGNTEAGMLFREFGRCFEGKRMNYWTNGLKDWFGLNDVADEDLAAENPVEEVGEELVLFLNPQEWKMILAVNARAELIRIAAERGKDGVLDFLDELPRRQATHQSGFKVNRPRGLWAGAY